MFNKLEEEMGMSGRNMPDTKKTPFEFLKVKVKMSETNSTPDVINITLDIQKKR